MGDDCDLLVVLTSSEYENKLLNTARLRLQETSVPGLWAGWAGWAGSGRGRLFGVDGAPGLGFLVVWGFSPLF